VHFRAGFGLKYVTLYACIKAYLCRLYIPVHYVIPAQHYAQMRCSVGKYLYLKLYLYLNLQLNLRQPLKMNGVCVPRICIALGAFCGSQYTITSY